MKALFSIHEIHSANSAGIAATKDTPGKPPKVVIVKPGTAFYANDADEHDFFLESGAARLATAEESRDLETPESLAKSEEKAKKATEKAAVTMKAAAEKDAAEKAAAAKEAAGSTSGGTRMVADGKPGVSTTGVTKRGGDDDDDGKSLV